jgi:flagellar motor protein MotB
MLRLLAVAGLTLAGAFYWPLYRAHEELTAEYASLNQKARSLDREIAGMRTELGTTKARRDELEARRGMDQSRERTSRELVEQTKADLSAKLARYVEKGTMVVAVYKHLVVVRLPAAVAQNGAKAEVTLEARLALCTLASAVAARGAVDLRIVARDAGAAGESDKTRAPWELAADRSAAVARALIEKCKYPTDHVEVTVRSQARPGDATGAGDPKTAVDVEIDPGAGSALTAL